MLPQMKKGLRTGRAEGCTSQLVEKDTFGAEERRLGHDASLFALTFEKSAVSALTLAASVGSLVGVKSIEATTALASTSAIIFSPHRCGANLLTNQRRASKARRAAATCSYGTSAVASATAVSAITSTPHRSEEHTS